LPDFFEVVSVFDEISGGDLQEAAGLYVAFVADETEVASSDTAGNIFLEILQFFLTAYSCELGAAGEADVYFCFHFHYEQLVQERFVFDWVNDCVGDAFSAAGGDKYERVETGSSEFLCEVRDAYKFVDIEFADGGVNLKADASVSGDFCGFYGGFEGTIGLPDSIVGPWGDAVEGERKGLYAGSF